MKPAVQGHKPQSLKTDIWTQAQLPPKASALCTTPDMAGWLGSPPARGFHPHDLLHVGGGGSGRELTSAATSERSPLSAGSRSRARPVAQIWSRQAGG